MADEKSITAITNGRLIDGTGADPVENATVMIEGNKIKAAGKRIAIPKGAKVLDVAGKTILPGLINSHIHLAGGRTGTSPRDAARPREVAMLKAAEDAKQQLLAGFTTVKDCGGRTAVFLRQAAAEGIVTGFPRIIAAGCLMTQTNGQIDRPPRIPGSGDTRVNVQEDGLVCDGPDECLKAVRFSLRCGADFIKILASGSFFQPDIGEPSGVEFNLEELTAFVKGAAQAGKFVTVHSQNGTSSKNSILAGVKTIDHVSRSSDEVVELGKKHNAIFVSTLAYIKRMLDGNMPAFAKVRVQSEWDAEVAIYKKIHDAGAVLAVGTDSFGDPLMSALEMELLVKNCNYTPMEVIVAATKYGAQACFIGDKTGTIETGKFADVIVVDGDPLADIGILQDTGKIKIVMLEGKVCVDRGL